LLGWKKDEWRKQAVAVSLEPPEKRPRTKDEEENWDMTLNTYQASRLTFRVGTLPRDQSVLAKGRHEPVWYVILPPLRAAQQNRSLNGRMQYSFLGDAGKNLSRVKLFLVTVVIF
jgi:hypothetical protein